MHLLEFEDGESVEIKVLPLSLRDAFEDLLRDEVRDVVEIFRGVEYNIGVDEAEIFVVRKYEAAVGVVENLVGVLEDMLEIAVLALKDLED